MPRRERDWCPMPCAWTECHLFALPGDGSAGAFGILRLLSSIQIPKLLGCAVVPTSMAASQHNRARRRSSDDSEPAPPRCDVQPRRSNPFRVFTGMFDCDYRSGLS
jgi:hypothetical protein